MGRSASNNSYREGNSVEIDDHGRRRFIRVFGYDWKLVPNKDKDNCTSPVPLRGEFSERLKALFNGHTSLKSSKRHNLASVSRPV